jgi:hypothetical protein
MVLKLNELCLSFIAREFFLIKNFDHSLLHASHKEKIIERLVNHNWLALEKNTHSLLYSRLETENTDLFQRKLIEYFFNGYQESLKLNHCSQVNDDFLKQISVYNKDANSNKKLYFRALKINRCQNVTGIRKKNFKF